MDEDGFDVDAVNAAYQKYLDAEANKERFKKRSEETWAAVRRGWEAGETGALLAQRYARIIP